MMCWQMYLSNATIMLPINFNIFMSSFSVKHLLSIVPCFNKISQFVTQSYKEKPVKLPTIIKINSFSCIFMCRRRKKEWKIQKQWQHWGNTTQDEENQTKQHKKMSNTDPTKNRARTQGLAMGKQFLLLIRHPPSYSNIRVGHHYT